MIDFTTDGGTVESSVKSPVKRSSKRVIIPRLKNGIQQIEAKRQKEDQIGINYWMFLKHFFVVLLKIFCWLLIVGQVQLLALMRVQLCLLFVAKHFVTVCYVRPKLTMTVCLCQVFVCIANSVCFVMLGQTHCDSLFVSTFCMYSSQWQLFYVKFLYL